MEIDSESYWDGLFSDNPSIIALVGNRFTGGDVDNISNEIRIIKVNPIAAHRIPVQPDEITDRRNEWEGNISLHHRRQKLSTLNDLYLANAFTPEFLAKMEIRDEWPIRNPKIYANDADRS